MIKYDIAEGFVKPPTCIDSANAIPLGSNAHAETPAVALSKIGLSLIPIEPGTKSPVFIQTKNGPRPFSWGPYKYKGTTPQQVKQWSEKYPDCSWAVLLGQPSGIVALDIDSDQGMKWVNEQGGVGDNPVSFCTGSSPGQWLYRLPRPLLEARHFYLADAVELRGTAHYSVIPPSVHPSGSQYEWQQTAPQSLEDIPLAPEWLLRAIREHLQPAKRQQTKRTHTKKGKKSTAEPRAASTDTVPLPEEPQPRKGPQVLASVNRGLLKSHALQFIEHGVFPGPYSGQPGCRNTACYLYAVLLKGAGVRLNTALQQVNKWAKRQAPTYGKNPDERPIAIVNAVWREAYRPDMTRLLSLETISGDRLTLGQARQAIRFYPQYRAEGSYIKRPAFDAALRVLDVLIDRKVTKPTAISLRELAEEAGISPRRVEEIAPFLDRVGVRVGFKQVNRSKTSCFNLTPLISLFSHTRRRQAVSLAVSRNFVECRGYKRELLDVVCWLIRRLGRLIAKVLDSLSAVLNMILITSWSVEPEHARNEFEVPATRAPPTTCKTTVGALMRSRGQIRALGGQVLPVVA